MNSRMSSSPSGLTYAQMYAITNNPITLSIPATLAWAPFRFCFSPPSWQQATNVMLEKNKDNINVKKLRAIALLDSMLNHNNKLMERAMMDSAEKAGVIAKEQSRKGKECVDQSLHKVLTTNIWRQSRQSGIICSTDLKSCYDRIVHSVATHCHSRLGSPLVIHNTRKSPLRRPHMFWDFRRDFCWYSRLAYPWRMSRQWRWPGYMGMREHTSF